MTDPGSPLLEARAISKSFAQTRALVGANLTLRPGVTHALLGANGAGKSTLSRVISGHVRRDGGEILYPGEPRDVRSPREALDAGIAMVMQETSLAPDLSVLENIFLPDLGRPGRLSRPTMRRRASEILADLGQEHAVSLDAEARDLEELRADARARRRQSHVATGRHPCAPGRQWRGQVDALPRHFRPRPA